MLVWAIASQKGGVGKTTTVVSLAGWLQLERQRVLVIDTDPHASLTSYFGFEDATLDHNLYDLYHSKNLTREWVLNTITHTKFPGIDLIASSMTLATIDRQLSGRVGVGRILSHALELIDDCYDVVLVDCPPVLGALMVNALVASTMILVPTQTEFLALKGLEGMVRTFRVMHNADPQTNVNYLVIPTMFDKRTKASNNSLDYLQHQYADKIWSSVIPIDTQFREASQRGLPLPLMDSNSRGSEAYRELLINILNLELEHNPQRISPACAAIVTMSDEDEGQQQQDLSPKALKDDPLAQSMGAMLSKEES